MSAAHPLGRATGATWIDPTTGEEDGWAARALERAPNVGPALAADLRGAGVRDVPQLRAFGALAAWTRLCALHPRWRTARTLCALEGAIRGVRWTRLPWLDVEELTAGIADGPVPVRRLRRGGETRTDPDGSMT